MRIAGLLELKHRRLYKLTEVMYTESVRNLTYLVLHPEQRELAT